MELIAAIQYNRHRIMDNIISSGINQVNILGKRLPKLLQGNRKRAFRDLVRFVFQLLI